MAINRNKAMRAYATLAVLVPVTLLSFQNCAPFSAVTSASLSSSGVSGAAVMSASQPVGSALISKTMTFNLGSSGTTLALTIQSQSVGYSVANISISSGTLPLRFSGFRIWINGAQVANEPFSNGSVPMSAMTAATYVGPALLLNSGGAPSSSDSIVVGFTSFIEAVPTPTPTATPMATATPVPSATPVLTPTATPAPTATPDPDIALGAQLYKVDCASCHGELGFSSKNGRTAAQITASLTSIPSMRFLKNELSASDIDKIAKALK